jgi:hypothetical protein
MGGRSTQSGRSQSASNLNKPTGQYPSSGAPTSTDPPPPSLPAHLAPGGIAAEPLLRDQPPQQREVAPPSQQVDTTIRDAGHYQSELPLDPGALFTDSQPADGRSDGRNESGTAAPSSAADEQPDAMLLAALLERQTSLSRSLTVNNDGQVSIGTQINTSEVLIARLEATGNLIIQFGNAEDCKPFAEAIAAKLHASQEAMRGEHPDYPAAAKAIEKVVAQVNEAVRRTTMSLAQLMSSEPGEGPQSQQGHEHAATTPTPELARKLVVTASFFAAVAADLVMTGGLITMASLGYSVGATFAVVGDVGTCTCGKMLGT